MQPWSLEHVQKVLGVEPEIYLEIPFQIEQIGFSL